MSSFWNTEQLQALLTSQVIQITSHTLIDSTQTWLSEQTPPPLNHYHLCLAEQQSAGRGRRGRRWQSNAQQSILVSLSTQWHMHDEKYPLISLITAVSLLETLHKMGAPTELGFKWPNDLYCYHKKLGGILVESSQSNQAHHVVIGFGINLQNIALSSSTDLATIWPKYPERHTLLSTLINALIADYQTECSLETWKKRWDTLDLSFNNPIEVIHQHLSYQTQGAGIEQSGELLTAAGPQLRADQTSIRLLKKT